MKFLLLIALICQTAFAEHRGGNGGDPSEIALKKRLQNVAKYIDHNPDMFLSVSHIQWNQLASEVTLQLTTKVLRDRYGSKRCALNFEQKKLIIVNEKCVLEKQFSGRILNALLAHELLNLKNIETPRNARSQYWLSEKFLNIPDEIVTGSLAPYIVKECSIRLTEELTFSKVSIGILGLKGYRVTTSSSATFTLGTDQSFKSSTHLISHSGVRLWERTFSNLVENLIELPLCLEL